MKWIDTAAITIGQRRLSGADRLLTLLTPSHGRMRVVARSACLPKGPLGSALEPFGVSRVVLSPAKGEGLYRVDSADRVSNMVVLRADLRRMGGGGLVCAWARALARQEDALVLYRLLHRSLVALDRSPIPVATVVARFLWRLTLLSGVGPTLFRCVQCQTSGKLTGFRRDPGGTVCTACQTGADWPLSDTSLRALRIIAEGDPQALCALPEALSRPLVSLAQSYLRGHFGDYLPGTAEVRQRGTA